MFSGRTKVLFALLAAALLFGLVMMRLDENRAAGGGEGPAQAPAGR